MKKNDMLFAIYRRGGQINISPDRYPECGRGSYSRPCIEFIYCDETAPLLDSPTAGFGGDEGGLDVEDLD